MGKHFPVFVTSNKEVVQPNDRVECVVILSDVLHTFGRNGNNGQLCNFFYCLQMRDRTLYSADRMFPCAHGFNGIVEFLQALPLGDAAIVDLLANIADVDIFGYWPTAKVFSAAIGPSFLSAMAWPVPYHSGTPETVCARTVIVSKFSTLGFPL